MSNRACGHFDYLPNCWTCNEHLREFMANRLQLENRYATRRETGTERMVVGSTVRRRKCA